jgi:hypothetical protein
MALLGLMLLPSHYRAGAERAHAHSLIQLWADATSGSVRHHPDHGITHPGSGFSSSWFDPWVGNSGSTLSLGLDDERPDAMEQQEAGPASSGVHLLVTAMTAIGHLGLSQVPIAVADRRHNGLPPRILVPPPRLAPTA